jgi:hypothetical protein
MSSTESKSRVSAKRNTSITSEDYEIEYDTSLKTFDYRASLLALLLPIAIEDTILFCERLPAEGELPADYQRWGELWKHTDAQLDYLLTEGQAEKWLTTLRESLNVAASDELDDEDD